MAGLQADVMQEFCCRLSVQILFMYNLVTDDYRFTETIPAVNWAREDHWESRGIVGKPHSDLNTDEDFCPHAKLFFVCEF